jgi:hypothetical protein
VRSGLSRNKTGGYSLIIKGDYSGTGTASITSSTIAISVDIQSPNGSKLTISFGNMPLVNDRFSGTNTIGGSSITLSGRVDLPAATDPDQTPAQAITGRVTATLMDAAGKGARLMAIQDEASRGR